MKDPAPLELIVNGSKCLVAVSPDTVLSEVLRDHLGLTGTKVGCGIGQCGACTVLIAGRPARSCRVPVGEVLGREILTIESLSRGGDLHPLQSAFVAASAVQCGFCLPGMIMELAGLFRIHPQPSEDRVRRALAGHLCRCTGYLPILEAVRLYLGRAESPDRIQGGVGGSPPRDDAVSKVNGSAVYTGDLSFPGQLYGKLLRSPIAHGRVKKIAAGQALELPGVVRVITEADIPGGRYYGKARRDQPVLARDRVRFIGDPVALVLAETVRDAERAVGAIEVEYEIYDAVYTAEEAEKNSAPLLHRDGNLVSEFAFQQGGEGDIFRDCEVILEDTYETQRIEHACLEPEAAVAYHDDRGVLTVIGPTQNVFFDRREIAHVLGLKREQVRVLQPVIGGSFGKREDLYAQIHCALGAFVSRRPVRMVFSREETFQVTTKRHPFRMKYRTGADRAGRIIARDIEIVADAGAYASWTPNIVRKAALHAGGPYRVPNVRVRARAFYTNNPPSGAMRGFGVPQVAFAGESQIDALAARLGMDPVELRRLNLLTDGSVTAAGQKLEHCSGLARTLERARSAAEEDPRYRPEDDGKDAPRPGNWRRGRGYATILYGIGYGCGIPDIGSAAVELTSSGRVEVRAGAVDYGQGVVSVLKQITVTELGISPDRVTVIRPDTHATPDSGSTVASRQTYITGSAVREAARGLRGVIAAALGGQWGVPAEEIRLDSGGAAGEDGREFSWAEIARLLDALALPRKRQSRFRAKTGLAAGEAGEGPYAAYSFATQVADVEVNPETGELRVLRVIAAHDLGKAINPALARGQVCGGVMMGLGYALREEFLLENGKMTTANFDSYRVPRIGDLPEIVPILIEEPERTGPYGARGLGEPPAVATAPAVANAVFAATGVRIRSLPISPRKLKETLHKDRS